LATRLISRIRAELGAEIPIRAVFDTPTVAELTSHLTAGARVRPGLRQLAERPERMPLSFAQRRLWFLHRFEGPSATYNIPAVLRLTGVLDTAALTRAVRDVVVRHESLRTLIVDDAEGVPYQRVVPADEVLLDVPVITVQAGGAAPAVEHEAACLFDLATDIPIRTSVIRCGPEDHVLVLVIHHIAGDGESLAPLARDLAAAYTARLAGRAPQWTPLAVQYADYTLWQQELLGEESDPGSALSAQTAYWRQELAGVPQPLQLPTDRTRPAAASYRGDTVEIAFEPELLTAADKLARERGATVSMVLQSALAVLLRQLGAGDDITIGSPIAGRTDEALTDLVGFFANTWVLRADLSGNPSFERVLERVRDKALAAYDNQDAPFERLVELLNPERSTAYQPYFQVMLAWQNITLPDFALPGLQVTPESASTGAARFDLFFNLAEMPGQGVRGVIEYATDLFDRPSVERLADRFVRALRQLVADPGRPASGIDILTPDERERWESLRPAAEAADTAGGDAPAGATRWYVLDARLRPVVPGVPGELYAAATGPVDGAPDRARQADERPVADPFGPPGSRMYRTGEAARWTADGVLERLGRIDDQVAFRGSRIRFGEIETVLAAHPAVAQAAVDVRGGEDGTEQLVAYVVPVAADGAHAAAGMDTAALWAHVAALLPERLVPTACVVLERLPLTADGRPDRAALPAPEPARPEYRAPRTPQEEILAVVYAEVLGLERVGIDDGFFALGGHSVLAARLISRIRSELGVEIPIRVLFEAPSIAELSRRWKDLATSKRPRLRRMNQE
ncbi:condensation domain-containing protein, partial [Streptomyces sp. NPDC015032]|uniref:condensation domain-containing protein n=1 Tax=Streptomyces sp. NPDC015032 TaxID=3364937 RepID=UPI0036FC58C7